ncbi:hypothetical protein [Fluviispira sanaruensis]|uniref:Uncharacterized protein n=1 Tax=Fluviispira sanaruensis TaxID=2493639 RepID=A0A4P2VLS1_FLUSA|nr:hypothetical protein [Fluviispira sanaruensis]BBH52934.1 hypothetical protein JCM31447_13770 [Fluviispira sanaruensis]
MLIILLSISISFITLFILFFRVKNSKKREIPSWFLGKKNRFIINNNIVLKKPPPIPVILIILITSSFSYIYFPKETPKSIEKQNNTGLVWLDPSLSAKISRNQDNFNPSDEAEKILALSYNNYGLENNFTIKNGEIDIYYKIVPLESKTKIKDFLESENNKLPSPFIQSIQTEKVAKIIKENTLFSNNKSKIIVLSDGKFESLQGILTLKNFFGSAYLRKSSPSQVIKEDEKEIIPAELSYLWNEKFENKSDFINFDPMVSKIPAEARPHFYLSTLHYGDTFYDNLTAKKNKNDLPLFIVCTDRFPGAIELDPFSSLRSLINFFNNEFIEKKCLNIQKDSVVENDAWKFRNPALWIVPITNDIISLMNKDFKFWTPQGFDANFDTLIYVGSSLLNNENGEVKKSPVQLDNGAYPVPIVLLPPPPSAEIGHLIPGEKLEYKGRFKTFFTATDGTPLAWKSSSLPFFYLRTTTATPNGELGRSRGWTNFWFDVANTVKKSNLSFTKVKLDDANKLQERLEEAGLNTSIKFTEILDLKNFNFKPAEQFSSGLYKIANGRNWVLIQTSVFDSQQIFISPDEFAMKFSEINLQMDTKIEDKNTHKIIELIIAFICIFLLFWLWKKPKIIALIFGFFMLTANPKRVFAQEIENNDNNRFNLPLFYAGKNLPRNVDTENIPFKIAWCSQEIPKNIENNYEKFRTALIRRGTIQIPKKLIPDACKPGEAEIWWTDNISLLSKKSLIEHISNGGIFIVEGAKSFPSHFFELDDIGTGLEWESPPKRGMFYRSFYLLNTLNGCINDSTKVLMLKKKINAQAPYALITDARFFSSGEDCYKNNLDYKMRSFINIMYSFLTTDYKEDQLQLPEILNRIRNLGLEP